MPTPAATVAAFLSLSEKAGGMAQAIRDYFTPNTVWGNMGMSKTTGPEEAVGVLAGFGLNPQDSVMRVDRLAIAAHGDKVLTERVDHVIDSDGKSVMAFPLMGIFEIKDGKIAAWRDYFDPSGLSKLAHD